MLRPETTRKRFVEKVLRIVQIHLDFFEDNLLFILDVGGIETRVETEIADDVEGDGKILVENFGVETDLLFGGEGVEHAADGIHFAGDGFGGAALRAFEDHVFDEMGEAIFLGNFAARTVANPDADGDGANVGHRLGDDDEPVGKNVALDVANLRGHKGIVTHGEQWWRAMSDERSGDGKAEGVYPPVFL